MPDISDELKANLGKLNPAAKARIEAALKASVEKELAGEVGKPGSAAAFSRGILFSKSGKSVSFEEQILPALQDLDDAAFKSFMNRVAALKANKPG